MDSALSTHKAVGSAAQPSMATSADMSLGPTPYGYGRPGSELILYLEPRPTSQLRQAIDSLLTNASLTFGHSEALRYVPHVTMIGFFSVPDTAATIHTVQAFLDTAITSLFHGNNAGQPQKQQQKVKQVIQPKPDIVLIDIEASPACHQLVQDLKSHFPSLHIRPKAINHLSLCYWLESDNDAPLLETKVSIAAAIAQQARALIPNPMDSIPWDIVLYSIDCRNQQGHEPYQFQEIQRWQLPS